MTCIYSAGGPFDHGRRRQSTSGRENKFQPTPATPGSDIIGNLSVGVAGSSDEIFSPGKERCPTLYQTLQFTSNIIVFWMRNQRVEQFFAVPFGVSSFRNFQPTLTT